MHNNELQQENNNKKELNKFKNKSARQRQRLLLYLLQGKKCE